MVNWHGRSLLGVQVHRSMHIPRLVPQAFPRPRTDDMREMVETLQAIGWCPETRMVKGPDGLKIGNQLYLHPEAYGHWRIAHRREG